jgi:hypothetical protein
MPTGICHSLRSLGVVLGNVPRRHKPDALRDHRLHVFRRNVVAMLDSVDAGFDRIVLYTSLARGFRTTIRWSMEDGILTATL